MRFSPIEKLLDACPETFVEEGYNALINELGVTAWHWHEPNSASELERFLVYGTVRSRKDDFFRIGERPEYRKLAVFDHAICFKSKTHGSFVLTMPYGTPDEFYSSFDVFANAYERYRSRVVELAMTRPSWKIDHLLPYTYQKMMAKIVPDRFKVRMNGDFAAIITNKNWIRDIAGVTHE